MKNMYHIRQGRFYPPGVTRTENGYQFVRQESSGKVCGVRIYKDKKEIAQIEFPKEYRCGSLYSVVVENLPQEADRYRYYLGEDESADLFAGQVLGKKRYGKEKEEHFFRLPGMDYDWEGDRQLEIPLSDSVIYGLHVRGFTRHASSGVSKKGTFAGLTEKTDYLKELGITAVELLPCYEFDELEKEESAQRLPGETRLNYWGFKEGFYFAPKSAYAFSQNPGEEFRDMVKILHKSGIEVIMQFYFPETVAQSSIVEIARFWVREYHVDGIHFLGPKIPLTVLASDPFLQKTKLFYYQFPSDALRDEGPENGFKNLACYRDDFMYDMRRYLKGDEDCLEKVLYHLRDNPASVGMIHYIACYNGFTLRDLVSYDRKHNEANGEDNRDGTDYNFSWNCGAEGKSKKRTVQQLREKQMRNALALVMLAQGTPYLQSGDEFGQTQEGNNNPYCQDNKITWLDWSLAVKNCDFLLYTKRLISFRKNHPVFHREEPCKLMDYLGCGYPDVSYHGEEAWKAALENYNRHAGVLYCGKYVKKDRKTEDDYFYVAYNMHWKEHVFALPRLPKGLAWSVCMDTSMDGGFPAALGAEETEQTVLVRERSVCVLKSAPEEGKNGREKQPGKIKQSGR